MLWPVVSEASDTKGQTDAFHTQAWYNNGVTGNIQGNLTVM